MQACQLELQLERWDEHLVADPSCPNAATRSVFRNSDCVVLNSAWMQAPKVCCL